MGNQANSTISSPGAGHTDRASTAAWESAAPPLEQKRCGGVGGENLARDSG
jgi:hypothetical protein